MYTCECEHELRHVTKTQKYFIGFLGIGGGWRPFSLLGIEMMAALITASFSISGDLPGQEKQVLSPVLKSSSQLLANSHEMWGLVKGADPRNVAYFSGP